MKNLSFKIQNGKVTTAILLAVFQVVFVSFMVVSCGDKEQENLEEEIQNLPKLSNVVLNYAPSEQRIELPRNVEKEGATLSLKDGGGWIKRLTLNSNVIHFSVSENTETVNGCRFDTIEVNVKGKRIGTICVSQARNAISNSAMKWAISSASFARLPLSKEKIGGLEMTKMIYNLEKETGGKDSYKNYPAFAFCIEMNHDPENNMEFYLPSLDEMYAYAQGQSFSGSIFIQHNFWWSSTENSFNGNAYKLYSKSYASHGAVNKSDECYIVAFRNGRVANE